MNERLKSRPPVKRRRKSTALRVLKELMGNPLSAACLLFVVFLILVIIFAEKIVPYELGIKMNGSARLLKPCAEHIFGCDNLGRDMFSRMVHGTRNSLSMGIGVTAVVMVAGTILGAICAYYGGVLDMVIMRICDLFLCIPGILMALALVAALGPGRKNLLIAIGISSIPGVTRQFRALMLNVISNDYITAARASGARDGYIILKHVLPNVMAYIVLTATSSISGMIMQISGLSYIGMGIQQPEPEWGAMLSDARTFLADGPHLMIIPAVTILLVSLAFNLLGDALRDALDPRLKGE